MGINIFSSKHLIDLPTKKKTDKAFEPFIYEPKFVYVPIEDDSKNHLENLLPVSSVVKKGTIIGREKETNFPYYSPISGYIKEIVGMPFSDFSFRECFKIENDYLSTWQEVSQVSGIDNYSKGDIYNFIKNSGIIERGNRSTPIYKIFEPEYNIHTLLINAIEFNLFSDGENLYTSNFIDYIYYVIPYLKKLSGINRFIICINPSQKGLESKIISSKKSYNDISLEIKKVDEKYPSFVERNLARNFTRKNYNFHLQEIGYASISLFSLEMLGRFFFEGKRPDLFCYDLEGEVNNPAQVISPFGVLASNMVSIIGKGTKYNEEDLLYIESDPISGQPHANLNYLLLSSSKGIIASKKVERRIYPCIGCGKCIDVCPNDLIPIFIYKSRNIVKGLRELDVEKCDGCGNCSYVCPSNIDLTSVCVNAKLKIKD